MLLSTRNIFKSVPATTVLLVYLFVCGVLFLIGFWSTFRINIFSLIDVFDIPKHFVFPLMISHFFFIINLITGTITTIEDKGKGFLFIRRFRLWWIKWQEGIPAFPSYLGAGIGLFILLLWFSIPEAELNPLCWAISSIVVAYYLLFLFVRSTYVKTVLTTSLFRFFVGHFLIFFPISCFTIGKELSIDIYMNYDIQYVNVIE